MNPLDYGPPGRLLARMARMESDIKSLEDRLSRLEARIRARLKEEADRRKLSSFERGVTLGDREAGLRYGKPYRKL